MGEKRDMQNIMNAPTDTYEGKSKKNAKVWNPVIIQEIGLW